MKLLPVFAGLGSSAGDNGVVLLENIEVSYVFLDDGTGDVSSHICRRDLTASKELRSQRGIQCDADGFRGGKCCRGLLEAGSFRGLALADFAEDRGEKLNDGRIDFDRELILSNQLGRSLLNNFDFGLLIGDDGDMDVVEPSLQSGGQFIDALVS